MPSVQELLAALEADKSPFISLLEGVAGGYANEQQNRVQNAMKLMELHQMMGQQAQQAEMQRQIKTQMEAQTQSQLRGLGSPSSIVPTQKFEQTISQDEKGNYSRSFKTADMTPKSFQAEKYQDAEGKTRIGKFDPTIGNVIKSPSDSLAPMEMPMKRGSQFVGIQGNNAVMFDPNAQVLSLQPLPGQGIISPKVAPLMPAGEVSKIGDVMNMKEKLDVIRETYSPEFVGMFDAVKQAAAQKTGIGATKQAARFRQSSQDIKDSLLRARSGAQINEQEYQRLLPIVPNENQSEVDFLSKLDRFDEVLNGIIESKQSAFQTAGYNTPNFIGTTPRPTRSGGVITPKKIGRFTVTVE